MTLDEIKRICEAATPAPWIPGHDRERDPEADKKLVWTWTAPNHPDEFQASHLAWETDSGCGGYGLSKADAEFCTMARTALPKALKIIEDAGLGHLLEEP